MLWKSHGCVLTVKVLALARVRFLGQWPWPLPADAWVACIALGSVECPTPWLPSADCFWCRCRQRKTHSPLGAGGHQEFNHASVNIWRTRNELFLFCGGGKVMGRQIWGDWEVSATGVHDVRFPNNKKNEQRFLGQTPGTSFINVLRSVFPLQC